MTDGVSVRACAIPCVSGHSLEGPLDLRSLATSTSVVLWIWNSPLECIRPSSLLIRKGLLAVFVACNEPLSSNAHSSSVFLPLPVVRVLTSSQRKLNSGRSVGIHATMMPPSCSILRNVVRTPAVIGIPRVEDTYAAQYATGAISHVWSLAVYDMRTVTAMDVIAVLGRESKVAQTRVIQKPASYGGKPLLTDSPDQGRYRSRSSGHASFGVCGLGRKGL